MESSQISQQTFTRSLVTPLFWFLFLMLSSKLFSKYSFYWFKKWERRSIKEDVFTLRKNIVIKKNLARKKKMIQKQRLMMKKNLLVLQIQPFLIKIARSTRHRRKESHQRSKNSKQRNSKLNVPQSKNTLIFMEVKSFIDIGGSLSSWFSSTCPWCLAQPFQCYSLLHWYHAGSTTTNKSFWCSNSIKLNQNLDCVKTNKQLIISKLHH